MKKILTLGIAALVLITMSSCQFNIFAAFDKIEIPNVADLDARASSDEDGFVDDVEDYVENDFLDNSDVTEEQIDAIVSNLETIYGGGGAADTVQQAAVLAGEIIINRDPVTSNVVNGVIGTVTDAMNSGDDLDSETILANIFPDNLDLPGLQNILNDLDRAAAAYADFSATVSSGGTADWMSDGEVGDMALYAVVSLVISDFRDQLTAHESGSEAAADDDLLDFINTGNLPGGFIPDNPFDTSDTGSTVSVSTFEAELQDILIFADLTDLIV